MRGNHELLLLTDCDGQVHSVSGGTVRRIRRKGKVLGRCVLYFDFAADMDLGQRSTDMLGSLLRKTC